MNSATAVTPTEETASPIASPKLRSISVAADDTVWGVTLDNAVVQSTDDSQPWTTIVSGKASTLAVSELNDMLYAIVDGVPGHRALDPGSEWHPMMSTGSTQLVKLWAGSDGGGSATVWATDSARTAWVWTASGGQWIHFNWTADAIASGADGALYRLDGGTVYGLDGQSWDTIATPEPFGSLSAGALGDVWGIGTSGSVYHYDGALGWSLESTAKQFPGATVSVGDDGTVWLLQSGNIYAYDVNGPAWNPIAWTASGTPAAISVSSEAEVWAIGSDGAISQYTEHAGLWEAVAGLPQPVTQVSATSGKSVWTVDPSGAVAVSQLEGTWTTKPAPGVVATMVAASGDGDVIALDAAGAASTLGSSGWAQISTTPALQRVSVANGQFRVGLDSSGSAYASNAGATVWTALGNAQPLVDVAVVDGGAVYGVDRNGGTWLYLGTWSPLAQPTATRLERISIHDTANFWGIVADGTPIDMGSDAEASVVVRHQLGWDTESVDDETQSTHLWIVNRAATVANGQGADGAEVFGLMGQTSPGDFRKAMCQGLYDADFVSDYNNPEYGITTWKSHFYDPDTGKNWWGDTKPTGLTQGSLFFNDAVQKYRAGDMGAAGHSLGLALHYFTDLSQPMHAANFTWQSSIPKPGYHTSFEQYVMELQATINPIQPYQESALGTTPEPHLINIAKNSKSTYFPVICPPGQMSTYFWYTESLRTVARAWAPKILTDAVTLTSQFLVAWIRATRA